MILTAIPQEDFIAYIESITHASILIDISDDYVDQQLLLTADTAHSPRCLTNYYAK